MIVRLRVPGALRQHCGGRAELTVELPERATVGEVLDRVGDEYPALERRVRDEQGMLRRHVNVFIGAENVRDLGGLAFAVSDGSELTVLPAVSGGS